MVEHRQLRRLGLTRHEIAVRVASGHLHPRHRGVYAVGHTAITQRGLWMAGVLAAGDRAVLSFRAGAALRGLGPVYSLIEITAPKERRRPGLKIHVSDLADDEVEVYDGIPVTTVARTLLDLAAVLPAPRLERAIREAEVQGYADATGLATLLERHAGRPGTPALRRVLGRAHDGRTRSELEEAFLVWLDARRLPRPRLNRWLEGGERDCVYVEQRLVIELDGWWSHGKADFHNDRRRDRAALVAGLRTVRVTFAILEDDGDALEADLRALLYLQPHGQA